MERTNPERKKFKEVDSTENFRPNDEASYYLGDNFELGGVEFGTEDGLEEEQSRNLSRFGQKVWNEKDYAGLGPREFRRPDQDIFHEVCEALTDNPRLDASHIEVEVANGCVYLRGQVSNRMDKREAERCVEFISGVKDVMNELHFEF